jgi:membrane-associated phospholipid phosphatase
MFYWVFMKAHRKIAAPMILLLGRLCILAARDISPEEPEKPEIPPVLETPAEKEEKEIMPFFSTLFHQAGPNILHSFTDNYGINFALGAAATYGAVKSGVDWKWNRMAYDHLELAYSGLSAGIIGFVLPVAVPLGLYLYGRGRGEAEPQITGLALGQAGLLAVGITTTFKAFTSRSPPGILDNFRARSDERTDDYSGDFRFGFLRRNPFGGWPSSHTAVAFAMAAVLGELYPERTALVVGSYLYAGYIGLGMSLFGHWLSDVFAGALLGYAIGKSVGRSFTELSGGKAEPFSFRVGPDRILFSLRI